MIQLYILLIGLCFGAPTTGAKPTVTVHILKPKGLTSVNAYVHKGRSKRTMTCGDGQNIEFDNEEDGIWTCKYIAEGSIGDTIHLTIESEGLSYPVFEGVLSVSKTRQTSFDFLLQQQANKWVAKRTSLHRNHFVDNLMVTDRELIIGLWSLLIVNTIGWMLWISRRKQ